MQYFERANVSLRRREYPSRLIGFCCSTALVTSRKEERTFFVYSERFEADAWCSLQNEASPILKFVGFKSESVKFRKLGKVSR